MAGEWYLDRKRGPSPTGPWPAKIWRANRLIAPALAQLVRLGGPEAVIRPQCHFSRPRFRACRLEHGPQGYADAQAAVEAAAAIEATGADDCKSSNAALRIPAATPSGWAAAASAIGAGKRDFRHGRGRHQSGRDRQRPTPICQNYEHVIADNEIHNLGLVYPAAMGIWALQSSRNRLRTTMFTTFFIPRFRWAGRGAMPPTSPRGTSSSSTTCTTSARRC